MQWHYVTANSCKDVGYDNYDFPYSWKPSNGISCPNPLSTDGSGAPEQVRFCLQCLILRLEHQTECLVLMPSPIQFLRSLWNAFPCLFPDAVDRAHGRLVCSCATALCAMPCVLTKKYFLPLVLPIIFFLTPSFFSSGTVPRYLSFRTTLLHTSDLRRLRQIKPPQRRNQHQRLLQSLGHSQFIIPPQGRNLHQCQSL